jgi:hypothetical protein
MTESIVSQIVAKIHNQRFLFALGVIAAVSSLAPFQLAASMGILGAGVLIVILDGVLAVRARHGLVAMTLALEFQQTGAEDDIQLTGARCRVMSMINPERERVYTLTPYRGGGGQGWLCPLPPGVNPNEVVEFSFSDADNGEWVTDRTVPQLLFPKVNARRVSQ